MIIFHSSGTGKASEKLEEKLKELVVAYQKMEHESSDESLPYIEEDGKVYGTEKEIDQWLQNLEGDLKRSRSLSGDGCYVDAKGGKTC